MERALADDLFDPEQWRAYLTRGRTYDAALEDIYPASLKRNLLAVLDAAITVVHARPERLAPSGMVETPGGRQSLDVARAAVRRLSAVALLERIILFRCARAAPFRFFYADVLRHVLHRWLYRLAFELCDADTGRIAATGVVGEVLDWQNVIRPSPAEVVDFLVRVRGRLSRTDAVTVMREALGETFAIPLRPSSTDLALPHVYLPPERDL